MIENRECAKSSRKDRFLYEHFARIYQKGKGKIEKYDTPLSMSRSENCSRPSGTHPKLGGYLLLTLGESRSERRSYRLLERSSKTSKRWCFCIYCLPFDNEASRPNRAYTTYESFPRILYHPQDVNELRYSSQKFEKSNWIHDFMRSARVIAGLSRNPEQKINSLFLFCFFMKNFWLQKYISKSWRSWNKFRMTGTLNFYLHRNDRNTTKIPHIANPNAWGITRMRMRLAAMKGCKNGFGTTRWEISFDHSNSTRQARIGSWDISCIFFLYIFDR